MKLFLIGTLLFSGGSAAAMTNENVREVVKERYHQVRERVANRVKENRIEAVRENGFPYPSEEKLENLTEDQQLALLTAIDQINATYNWAEMTDEEIQGALDEAFLILDQVAEENGFEHLPSEVAQKQFRRRVRKGTRHVITEKILEDLRADGLEYPVEERLANLTEEQAEAVLAKIDEFNETYDWANMEDEEIMDALKLFREEMKVLAEELGIERPHHDKAPEVEENTDPEI